MPRPNQSHLTKQMLWVLCTHQSEREETMNRAILSIFTDDRSQERWKQGRMDKIASLLGTFLEEAFSHSHRIYENKKTKSYLIWTYESSRRKITSRTNLHVCLSLCPISSLRNSDEKQNLRIRTRWFECRLVKILRNTLELKVLTRRRIKFFLRLLRRLESISLIHKLEIRTKGLLFWKIHNKILVLTSFDL